MSTRDDATRTSTSPSSAPPDPPALALRTGTSTPAQPLSGASQTLFSNPVGDVVLMLGCRASASR